MQEEPESFIFTEAVASLALVKDCLLPYQVFEEVERRIGKQAHWLFYIDENGKQHGWYRDEVFNTNNNNNKEER